MDTSMKLTKEDILEMWEWRRNDIDDSFLPIDEYGDKPVKAIYLSKLREVVEELKSRGIFSKELTDKGIPNQYTELDIDELFGEVLD